MFELETPRLHLRRFSLDDLDDLARIFRDPDVMKYMQSGIPRSREEAQSVIDLHINHWRDRGFGFWAVIDKTQNIFIGQGGLLLLDTAPEVEVGYLLAKSHWGRGFATELASASLEHGFATLGLNRIVAVANPDNVASRRVMEKIGMRYEKDDIYYGVNCVYYAFDCDHWQSMQK